MGNVPAKRLTKRQAEDLTERIREAAEQTWRLLQEARECEVWTTLGYDTWADYVRTEFGMGARASYLLLDQAKVIGELTEAANVQRAAHADHAAELAKAVSGRSAQKLKPDLPAITEKVKQHTARKRPADRAAIAAKVIAEHLEGAAKSSADETLSGAISDGSGDSVETNPDLLNEALNLLLSLSPVEVAKATPSWEGLAKSQQLNKWWGRFDSTARGGTPLVSEPAGVAVTPKAAPVTDIGEQATIFLRALKAMPAESHSVKVWEQFNRDLASKFFEAISAKTKALKGGKK